MISKQRIDKDIREVGKHTADPGFVSLEVYNDRDELLFKQEFDGGKWINTEYPEFRTDMEYWYSRGKLIHTLFGISILDL